MTAGALVIGVDVGGTKVSVATLEQGRTGEPLIHPTDTSGSDALIEQIANQVGEVLAGRTAAAVGIGIPSVVDFATGTAKTSVNIPLRDVPLRAVLGERLGVPVFVDNDATVAAFAEAHDEHGQVDVRSLFMFTVGTGVGGGIVIDGRSYRGATGAAGEVGHTLIAIDPAIPAATSFPQPGSLESLSAGHVLDHLAREAAAVHPDSQLGRLLASNGSVAGPDAVTAAKAGDEVAVACIATLGRRLGVGVANAINVFDPQVVAIGGGVSSAGELLLAPLRAAALEYVLDGVGSATEIRIARSGPQAGVRGAGLLARSELKSQNGEAR
ncbi:MAG TPA: ROK family protein [Solirubrobacteraceae bacterium]|nr:ROK family protein [Solirubrobacteraceae bacterium]